MNLHDLAEKEDLEAQVLRLEVDEEEWTKDDNVFSYDAVKDIVDKRRDLIDRLRAYGLAEMAANECKKSLALCSRAAWTDEMARRQVVADLNYDLAVLYVEDHKMKCAKAAYSEALSLYRELVGDGDKAFLADIAKTLIALADIHKADNDVEIAESELAEAVESYAESAESHIAASHIDAAEWEYEEALKYCRELFSSDSTAYIHLKVRLLNGSALVHAVRCRFDEFEKNMNEALALCRRQASSGRTEDVVFLARMLNDFGILNARRGAYEISERLHAEALSRLVECPVEGPDDIEIIRALTQVWLAVSLVAIGKRDKASALVHEAFTVLSEIEKRSPCGYAEMLKDGEDGLLQFMREMLLK